MPIVLTPARDYGRTNGDIWTAMVAAELFADHFSQAPALLQQVIDRFTANPECSCAAAALAEVILRRHEPDLEKLLKEKAAGQHYGFTAGLKVMAAIGTPEQIVEALFWLQEGRPSEKNWQCAYWVPTLLRRIEREPEVGDKLIEAIPHAPSPSAKISLLALAGRGSKGRIKHHALFTREAEQVTMAVAPPVGFDVTSGSNRLAFHVLHELLT